MPKESSEVISLIPSIEYLPWSRKHRVKTHRVDLENHFINELSNVSDTIEHSLDEGRDVTVVGRTETGLLAVAALMEHPEISEVITFWTVFKGNTLRFQREGNEWLNNHQRDLPAPLRRRVTTVYTHYDALVGPHDRLEGARVIPVRFKDPQIKTWRQGLQNLLNQPVEVYFNPQLHK